MFVFLLSVSFALLVSGGNEEIPLLAMDGEIGSTPALEEDEFFEGPEKTLMVEFNESRTGSLRQIPQARWAHILGEMGVAILSKIENTPISEPLGCTAYLLSESSLFVYDDRIVFKTCGMSSPLRGLVSMLDLVRGSVELAQEGVKRVYYSRPSFFRPSEQLAPHRSFDEETAFLDHVFPNGSARRLGTEARGVDFWVVNFVPSEISDWTMSEFYVTDLGARSMETFSQKGNVSTADFWKDTQPDELDEYVFEPYGYSANALYQHHYSTIHASPQPSSSYMSYATNVPTTESKMQVMTTKAASLSSGRHISIFNFAFASRGTSSQLIALDGYDRSYNSTVEGPGFVASLSILTVDDLAAKAKRLAWNTALCSEFTHNGSITHECAATIERAF